MRVDISIIVRRGLPLLLVAISLALFAIEANIHPLSRFALYANETSTAFAYDFLVDIIPPSMLEADQAEQEPSLEAA